MTDIDISQTDHLLNTTRAVRKRLDLEREVAMDVVLDCIEIAIQAPTGSNSQRWRWILVTDPDLKAQIADHYRVVFAPYSEMQHDAIEGDPAADPTQARVMSSADHLAEVLQDVPVLAIPCVLGRVEAGTPQMEQAGFYGSILPAVWSLQLALRSRGLGSAWTTLHLGREAEVARLLGIPDTVTQVALLPIAHYTGDTFQPAKRRPAAEITYLNGWKQPLG